MKKQSVYKPYNIFMKCFFTSLFKHQDLTQEGTGVQMKINTRWNMKFTHTDSVNTLYTISPYIYIVYFGNNQHGKKVFVTI